MTEEETRYATHVATKAWLAQQPSEDVAVEEPRPKAETYHVSGRHFDHELGCTVVRGIGFSWRCTCGKRGRIVSDRGEAVAGKREHEAEHRD